MSQPLILMYHRVADDPVDYWKLAVSPAHFEEQLSVLRRSYHPLPLVEFVDRLVAGTLPPNAVALTFDDGYVDNLTAALPRLEAADVPATVFIATGFIDQPEPFWWDELANLILCASGAERFELLLDDKVISVDLPPDADTDGPAAPPQLQHKRAAALEAIYQPIRRQSVAGRLSTMAKLRAVFGIHNDPASLGRPMTSGEIQALVKSGLIAIGGHSVTHPILPELQSRLRQQEMIESKRRCEAIVAAPIAAFAYPFGEYNAAICEETRDAGFSFACSTGRGSTISASDLFALRRTFVTDLDGDAFAHRLRCA